MGGEGTGQAGEGEWRRRGCVIPRGVCQQGNVQQALTADVPF